MDEKNELRHCIWNAIEKNGLSLSDIRGKIPDFEGSESAADQLRSTCEWMDASVIFVSPDSAQRKVRENVLLDEKTLIVPTPKIERGYLIIYPSNCKDQAEEASTIKGSYRFGQSVDLFPKIDMVVEGSVAVDEDGSRLGKGGGYGDVEISHLMNVGSINPKTPIVSTVHEIQIVDHVPVEEHDQNINMIVTPERILRMN